LIQGAGVVSAHLQGHRPAPVAGTAVVMVIRRIAAVAAAVVVVRADAAVVVAGSVEAAAEEGQDQVRDHVRHVTCVAGACSTKTGGEHAVLCRL